MGFFIIDEKAAKERSEAIERSEASRARRESNRKPPARPADWKGYKRVSDDEIDNEVLRKTKKGR